MIKTYKIQFIAAIFTSLWGHTLFPQSILGIDDSTTVGEELKLISDYADEPDTTQVDELSPEEIEIQTTIFRYADNVLQLEMENGAYNNELVEELIGLGQAYSNFGTHEEALKVYTRALHINRVNEGLHNINQLPILELIIKTNTEMNSFEELNKNYGYLLWVYDRNYAKDDMHLVPAFTRAANWHMDAYDITEPPDSIRHLIMATNFFSKAVDVVETAKGPDSRELINPLYGIVNANFKLVEPFGFIPNIDTFISGKLYPLLPSNFDIESDRGIENRNRYTALKYSTNHLSRIVQDQKYAFSLIQNSYRSGRNALERILEIHEKNPDLPEMSHAYAHTHMGDWYLRFYKRSYAMSNYKMAYQLVLGTGYSDEALMSLFGRPRSLGTFEEIPEFDFETYKVASAEVLSEHEQEEKLADIINNLQDTKFVLVDFKVTKYGAVRNLNIIASNPSDSVRFRRMARNTINSTPFRPRLENGQPIVTENVKMLYRFH